MNLAPVAHATVAVRSDGRMSADYQSEGSQTPQRHAPVLLKEIVKLLQPRPGQILIDGMITGF